MKTFFHVLIVSLCWISTSFSQEKQIAIHTDRFEVRIDYAMSGSDLLIHPSLFSPEGQCEIKTFTVTEARFVCSNAPYQLHFKLDRRQEWTKDAQIAKEKYGVDIDLQKIAETNKTNSSDTVIIRESLTLGIGVKKVGDSKDTDFYYDATVGVYSGTAVPFAKKAIIIAPIRMESTIVFKARSQP